MTLSLLLICPSPLRMKVCFFLFVFSLSVFFSFLNESLLFLFFFPTTELKDFFKEYNPTKAYVVVGRNGRSKGFGFVCFENDGDQQAALKFSFLFLKKKKKYSIFYF